MGWIFAVVGLSLLIVLHELGHFAAAKAVGMRVEKFSLFFGPKLVRVRRGETEYSIGLLPLGGFVSITGTNPLELKKIDLRFVDRSYYFQKTWRRVFVIAAGPCMNLLVAFVILWGLAIFSPAQPTPYQQRIDEIHNRPSAALSDPQRRLDGVGGVLPGVGISATIEVPTRAAHRSVNELWYEFEETISRLPELISSSKARERLHSVLGISVLTKERYNQSLPAALRMLALISLSLAVLNLLPIFPLDGGHIAWALAEKLRGKRLSVKAMAPFSAVGLLIVIGLTVIGFSNDIGELTGGPVEPGRYRYCGYQTANSTPCIHYGSAQGAPYPVFPAVSLQPAHGVAVHLPKGVVATVAAETITTKQFDAAYTQLRESSNGWQQVPDPPAFTRCIAAMRAGLENPTATDDHRHSTSLRPLYA